MGAVGSNLDVELIEPPGGVAGVFCHGFAGYDCINGILTCSGFQFQKMNGRIYGLVNQKVIMPVDGLQDTIMRAMQAAAIYGFDVQSLPAMRRSLS
jgi:hypothetical protein